MYVSCLTAVILVGAGFSVSLPMILLGGLFEGTFNSDTCSLSALYETNYWK